MKGSVILLKQILNSGICDSYHLKSARYNKAVSLRLVSSVIINLLTILFRLLIDLPGCMHKSNTTFGTLRAVFYVS